jgi:hypothetical protein
MVRGGLAVPFYVIILAILGASINMTKKVPPIQKSYYTLLPHYEALWQDSDEDATKKNTLALKITPALRAER